MTLAGMLGATLLPASVLLCAGVAHADTLHVTESTPAAGGVIRSRHAEYAIRFDGLVDHSASRMYIVRSGRRVQVLMPLRDSAPEVLFTAGRAPPPGAYQLHWEARSPVDAVISVGDIPFSVAR